LENIFNSQEKYGKKNKINENNNLENIFNSQEKYGKKNKINEKII